MYNQELYHYGRKGMKWGVRRARGHAGPGRYLTKKRQQAGDKRDLERLNKGQHLSVGLTKKRQAAFDARDKAAIEKRMNEAEQPKNKGLSDKQKTALKVGAAVAGTAIAAYGVYKVSKYISNSKSSANTGRQAVDAYMRRYNDIMNTFGSDGTKFR